MKEITTVGLDLAKNVFQEHAVDANGEVLIRRQLRRSQVLSFFRNLPSCLIGIEACAPAHFSVRELLALGHDVQLMPPNYVRPYVKRNKNDMADAEAICEAVTRPNMRFVAVKNAEQQSVLMLHRTRELLVRQRTMLVNAIRAHMAEFGVVVPAGLHNVKKLLSIIMDSDEDQLPQVAKACLVGLGRQFMALNEEIISAEKRIQAWHRSNEICRNLETIAGIGPITATALAATVTNPSVFKSGREMAAWIGLVPRQNSTGGKERLGRISKQGDQYLRWLLVGGAMTVIQYPKRRGTRFKWLRDLIDRKPSKIAAVAIAS